MNEPIPKAILVEIMNLSSCHSREIDDIQRIFQLKRGEYRIL